MVKCKEVGEIMGHKGGKGVGLVAHPEIIPFVTCHDLLGPPEAVVFQLMQISKLTM